MSANELSKQEIVNLLNHCIAMDRIPTRCRYGITVPIDDQWNRARLSFDYKANLVKVANILYDENRRSIESRYGKCYCEREEIQEEDFFNSARVFNARQFYFSLKYYEYQSCEHPDYYSSIAYQIVRSLKEVAVEYMTSHFYNEDWGIPEPSAIKKEAQ